LARELDVRRLLVPAQAGVLSALGLARSGFRRDFARTLLWGGDELTWNRLQTEYQALREQAAAVLAADGLALASLGPRGELELRYPGQSYSLNVPLTPNFRLDFHQRHRRLYGHDFPERHPEAVVLRLHLAAPAPAGAIPAFPRVTPPRLDLPRETELRLPGGVTRAPLYHREALAVGDSFPGPALVLEDFATLLVLPGFRAEVLAGGHLLLQG
jgi:N-methylhydantoinase A